MRSVHANDKLNARRLAQRQRDQLVAVPLEVTWAIQVEPSGRDDRTLPVESIDNFLRR